jgi:uncharacterized protein (DUF433 family)
MTHAPQPIPDSLDQHIEMTPGVAGGKPRIAGRRIAVRDVVFWYEHMGMSVDEISTEYDLTLADVHAALAYYFDHRAEIDASIRVTPGQRSSATHVVVHRPCVEL